MKKEQNLFAFKLAKKQSEAQAKNKQPWKARDGVAIAGCTGNPFTFRYNTTSSYDGGPYC